MVIGLANVFPATLEELHGMLEFIREKAYQAGFGEAELLKIELASEEALANIILHAYPDSSGKVSLTCESSNKEIRIKIEDEGISFDPTKHEFTGNEKGGFGILLIQQNMDEVNYKRDNEKNILTLVKFKKLFESL